MIGSAPPTRLADGTIGYSDVLFRQLASDVPGSANDALSGAMAPVLSAGLALEFGGSARIMASVFGGVMFADDPIITSIAFALTVGVLIDAFVVRMMIVPAVMNLPGRRSWQLPRRADRLVPNVGIEGASLPAPRPAVRSDEPVAQPAE